MLPVVDQDGTLVGIVTRADLLRRSPWPETAPTDRTHRTAHEPHPDPRP
jgi:CBS-domain-containing membrane protein